MTNHFKYDSSDDQLESELLFQTFSLFAWVVEKSFNKVYKDSKNSDVGSDQVGIK